MSTLRYMLSMSTANLFVSAHLIATLYAQHSTMTLTNCRQSDWTTVPHTRATRSTTPRPTPEEETRTQ